MPLNPHHSDQKKNLLKKRINFICQFMFLESVSDGKNIEHQMQVPMLGYKYLTLCHTIPTFNNPESKPFEYIVEKEKMLVTSIFSFSHNVFYPLQSNFLFFRHIYFVVCKCFNFGLVLNFVVW